jgi:hypothetical protein
MVKSDSDLLVVTEAPTPMTTTSRCSSKFNKSFGFGESLGNEGARDGSIRRSLAAFEVSW